LTSLSASLLQSLADRISVGLLTLLRAHGALIREREDWRPILSLLQEFASMSPAASVPALETLTFLVREEGRVHVTDNNFDFCQQTLLVFLDAVLDTHVARQHLELSSRAPPDAPATRTRLRVEVLGFRV